MKTILNDSHELLGNSNLIKSNSKVSLLAIATLAISVGATNLEATNALEHFDASQAVATNCSSCDLNLLNRLSTTTNANTTSYIDHRLNLIINCINEVSPELSNEEQDAVLQQISSTPQFKDLFAAKLKQKVDADGYAFVINNSPISSYLNKALLADDSYSRVIGCDIYKDNKAAVDQELFGKEETNDTFKNAVAQHLFNKLKIYAPSNSQDTTMANLWSKQGTSILNHLKELKASNRYVKFTDLQDTKDLDIKKHHIVITDTELGNNANKTALQAFLAKNNNHEIVLDVGNSFVQNGELELNGIRIPKNLQHLTITNSLDNVTTTSDYVLAHCIGLTSFDSSGLTNVTTIGEYFLSSCDGLKSITSTAAKKDFIGSKIDNEILKRITWNIKD